MSTRLGFALHLAAILALAAGVSVGIVANAARDRLDTLTDLKPRLAGATVCELSGTSAATVPVPNAAPAPAATVAVRKTITDPAVLGRLVASLPAAELRPIDSVWNTGAGFTILDFPAEAVRLQVTPGMIFVTFRGEHYYASTGSGAFSQFVDELAK